MPMSRLMRKIGLSQFGRTLVRAIAIAVPALTLTVATSGVAGATGPSPSRWLLTGPALTRITQLDASLAAQVFDAPTTWVTGPPPEGWSSERSVIFPSLAGLEGAIGTTSLVGVKVVVYDIEHWSLTPRAEQRHPALSMQRFATLANANGLKAVMAPALDLTSSLNCPGSTPQARYLACDLAAEAARYATAVDIQAQSLEASKGNYADFVAHAAAQARAANPSVVLLAGLSTGPDGQAVTASQMFHAAQSTRSNVSGWWLNVPGRSRYCPNCGAPAPSIAVSFLRLLYRGEL
jgi:hypothetical protein